MSEDEGLRARKKRETRARISQVATKLFAERGFDQVTVEEIARVAAVSKMTLFNYFARKEDLVVDREPEMLERLRAACADRPLPGLRALFLDMIAAGHPLMGSVEGAPGFWTLVSSSPVLVARLWSMADAMEDELGSLLRKRGHGDADARIIATTVTALWRTAWREAVRRIADGDPVATVRAWQRRFLNRGFDAVDRALGPQRVFEY